MAVVPPPYLLQSLLDSRDLVLSSQALGSEVYVGCSNGQLLRFALQADSTSKTPDSYTLLSRQSLPNNKPITDIVLIPCIFRALILCDNQIHIFTLPSLDAVGINPIRNVISFAVDERHLRRAASNEPTSRIVPVEFCVLKRTSIGLYTLRDKLQVLKDIPFPQGGIWARRTGPHLCVADKDLYYVINLDAASALPVLPVSQTMDVGAAGIKPLILVISDDEFLIVSNIDGRGLGVFITGSGDPVRGTLEWTTYPKSISMDYPNVLALLPDKTIVIHDIETQAIVQIIPAPPSTVFGERLGLSSNAHGYLVPSTQQSDKLRSVSIPLLRS